MALEVPLVVEEEMAAEETAAAREGAAKVAETQAEETAVGMEVEMAVERGVVQKEMAVTEVKVEKMVEGSKVGWSEHS